MINHRDPPQRQPRLAGACDRLRAGRHHRGGLRRRGDGGPGKYRSRRQLAARPTVAKTRAPNQQWKQLRCWWLLDAAAGAGSLNRWTGGKLAGRLTGKPGWPSKPTTLLSLPAPPTSTRTGSWRQMGISGTVSSAAARAVLCGLGWQGSRRSGAAKPTGWRGYWQARPLVHNAPKPDQS